MESKISFLVIVTMVKSMLNFKLFEIIWIICIHKTFKRTLIMDATFSVNRKPIRTYPNWRALFVQNHWDKITGSVFRLFFRKFNSSPGMETMDEDEDVQAERLRVESGAADFDLVQLHRLTKTYQLIHKKIVAVNNISIGIPAGEVTILLLNVLFISIINE